MKTQKNKKVSSKIKDLKDSGNKEIINISAIVLAVVTLISLYSKATGFVGELVRLTMLSLFGFYGYIIPYVVIVVSVLYILKKLDLKAKLSYIISINLCILTIIHIIYLNNQDLGFMEAISTAIEFGKLGVGSGIVGGTLSYLSLALFGIVGSYILIFSILLISILKLTEKSFFKILGKTADQLTIFTKETASMFKNIISNNMNNKDDKKVNKKSKKNKNKNDENQDTNKNNDINRTMYNPKPTNEKVKSEKPINTRTEELKIFDYNKKEDKEEIEDLTNSGSRNTNSSKNNIDKTQNIDKSNINKKKEASKDMKQVDMYEEYEFPPIDILKQREAKSNTREEEKEVRKNADKLIETLADFGIEAKVSQVSIGPSITQYEVQPAPGVKVSRIVSLSNDIALSLASSDLRMEAPIPGKSAIGIEIPNKDKAGVSLKEIIQSDEFKRMDTKAPMALGKDISGKPIIANIEKMPHLLIAGATGSGKSVCINTLIASIIYRAKPNEVKLLMIDPKMVELSVYNGIPHLLIPVVTEPKKAANALNWAVTEMNKRYQSFSESGVRDMKGYNKKVNDDSKKMPLIVIIIDELADLMMVAASEVEDYICRLAQMARAAGIHLIVATQRPSVDIITGTIKANIPSRISFAVSSQVDSRTILDTGGAEKLLGRGDMLFHPVGESKPIRIQGAFIDEEEVEAMVDFLKQENEISYKEEIIEEIEKQNQISEDGDVDELFSVAVDLFLDEGQASISLLQRKLKVGYARAARIVDEMEERGVVGGHEGSKPRKILINKDDLS